MRIKMCFFVHKKKKPMWPFAVISTRNNTTPYFKMVLSQNEASFVCKGLLRTKNKKVKGPAVQGHFLACPSLVGGQDLISPGLRRRLWFRVINSLQIPCCLNPVGVYCLKKNTHIVNNGASITLKLTPKHTPTLTWVVSSIHVCLSVSLDVSLELLIL